MSLTLTIKIRWEDSQQNCKDSVGGGSRTETMTVGGTDGNTARPTNNIQRTMNKSLLPPMRGCGWYDNKEVEGTSKKQEEKRKSYPLHRKREIVK